MQWDLAGQGVREIRRDASDQYLVIAGDAGEGGVQHLYTWDGSPAHEPVATQTDLSAPAAIDGAWESLFSVPGSLSDGATLSLIEDNGDTVFYGGSSVAKDLAGGLEKDWADSFQLRLPGQAIAFSTTPPSPAYTGTSYAPAASGGASGNSVAFSIDPSSAGACSLSAGVVRFLRAGTCVLDADQAGSFQYAAAPRVQQTIQVSQTTPAILCSLTDRFVQGSAKYQHLNALGRLVTDALVTGECKLLTQLAARLGPAQRAALIGAYDQGVQGLASAGWLTSAQAATLVAMASGL